MTNTTEMPTTAQLNAVDHMVEAWVQARCAGFSDFIVHEITRMTRHSVEELVGTFPGSRVDKIMDNLESGMPIRRAFSSVLVGE